MNKICFPNYQKGLVNLANSLLKHFECPTYHESLASLDKILQAEKAKKLGFEAFILDDGWFSVRRDRESSLGDWYVNPVKFPEGLKMLATRIHRSELLFGLYFDIESVSCRSNLFEEHKDWVIHDESRKNFSSSNEE